MSLAPARCTLTCLALTATWFASGCQRAAAPAAINVAAADHARPEEIKLPAYVRPLLPEQESLDRDGHAQVALRAAVVRYEQAGRGEAGPRIRDLSATPAHDSPDLIREPTASSALKLAPPEPGPQTEAGQEPVGQEPVSEEPVSKEPVSVESGVPEDRLPLLDPLPPRAYQPRIVTTPEPAVASEETTPEPPAPTEAEQPSPAAAPAPVFETPVQPEPAPSAEPAVTAPPPTEAVHETSEFTINPEPPTTGQPATAQPIAAQPIAMQPTADRAAMAPVAERAAEISDHAFALAGRGMLFAARAELVQSLQLVAQALDVQHGSRLHSEALAGGLAALKEAQDFAPQSAPVDAVVNVAEIAKGHRTPVLRGVADDISPVIAQQQYFAYAQSQLAIAAGNEPAASQSLFRLGKIQAAISADQPQGQALRGPQAMVYYQAALAADQRNYPAANELGVLMARYGQLHEARRLLVHSVSVQPHVEGWHNLSIVHRRLGETDLATRADHERQLLAQQPQSSPASDPRVAWLEPQAFAASSRREETLPAAAASPPSAASPLSAQPTTAANPAFRGSASYGVTR